MTQYITLEKNQTRLRFLKTGDLYEIDSNGMMINQSASLYIRRDSLDTDGRF